MDLHIHKLLRRLEGDIEVIEAYTLVKVAPDQDLIFIEEIKKNRLVLEAINIYGEYDILVKTKTSDIQELHSFVYNLLRKIPDVTTTTTMIVAKIPN
jgi:DNA-binding Lrp family transcriptional regulator